VLSLMCMGRLGSAPHPCEDEAQDYVTAEPEYRHHAPFPVPEGATNVDGFPRGAKNVPRGDLAGHRTRQLWVFKGRNVWY
jgi:hypothetical protein